MRESVFLALAFLSIMPLTWAQTPLPAPTVPAGDLSSEIKAFKTGNYAKAAGIGEAVIKAYPKNVEARYYLANSYLKLNKYDLAQEQFKACTELAPKTQVAKFSQQALLELAKYPKPQAPSATGKALLPTLPPESTSEPNQLNRAILNECHTEQSRIMSTAKARMDRIHNEASKEIAKIKQQAEHDIKAVPKTIHSANGNDYENHSYKTIVESIQSEANRKVKIVEAREKHATNAALKDAETRANSIGNTGQAFSSQLNVSRYSNSRLTPVGTRLHVRNQMHFSGDAPITVFAEPVKPLEAPKMQKILPKH
ncbi:MAG: CDC27 family protein [Candidatus Obscuribacterales bacterium]|nr:CDC27 family protein [Candidatus Obscuribacterales bacterium]